MPRGIAKSGMRMTAKRLATAMQHQEVIAQQPKVVVQVENMRHGQSKTLGLGQF